MKVGINYRFNSLTQSLTKFSTDHRPKQRGSNIRPIPDSNSFKKYFKQSADEVNNIISADQVEDFGTNEGKHLNEAEPTEPAGKWHVISEWKQLIY